LKLGGNALKKARNQSELLKSQKLSSDASSLGYDRVNELVGKLRNL